MIVLFNAWIYDTHTPDVIWLIKDCMSPTLKKLVGHTAFGLYIFTLFIYCFYQRSVTLNKIELQRREQYLDIRYHETTGAILETGIRDKRKTRKGSNINKIALCKSNVKIANMSFLCMVFLITSVHSFLVKAIDCEKGVIKLNPWQNWPT